VAEVADHGVPQLRQRAILIASQGSDPCFLPAPSHGRLGLPDYRTLAEALASLDELGAVQPLSERKRAVYRQIPPGGNWRDLPDRVRQETMGGAYFAEGGRSGWWRRLDWDTPSPTILGMPDHSSTALVHPEEVRCLSVNECAALQTFPRWARFAGTPRSQYQQIGNAIPPLLGRVLGRHIAAFLAGERSAEPDAPEWRKISANRRIGTHGWAVPRRSGGMAVTLRHVRADHVWKIGEDCRDGN
jgi:DNA (cytosine-5)-methyltransferase 1